MTEDPTALALWQQLHDSAFPAGRMVHSNGFEEWLARRPDARAPEIEAAALDYLAFGVAPLDTTVTAAAWRMAPVLVHMCDLDVLLSSYKLSSNARTASQSAGRQLAVTAREVGLCDGDGYIAAVVAGDAAGNLAVVEGALQAHIGVSAHTAAVGSLRSALASVLSAAVRLGRLSPLAAQRIQIRHVGAVVALAAESCARPIDDLHSAAIQLDIAGMCHESRTQRSFAS
ncbi:MAG: urease accessory UreF family protein [Mycobacterium sp.]